MSSRSLNKVLLIGNLTRDPELRYTPQGTPVCTFGLATNRSWQPSAGGERQEETEFHRIVAWNKLAELCSELLFKGRKVFVEGRIQTRNWTDAQGQERTTVEAVIDNMIVLDNKRKDVQEGEWEETATTSVPVDDSGVIPSPQPRPKAQAKGPLAYGQDQPVAEKTDKTKKPAAKPKAEEPKAEPRPKADQPASPNRGEPVVEEDEKINPDDIPF